MKKKELLVDIIILLFLALLCAVCFYKINILERLGGDTGDFAYGLYAGMAQTIHGGEYPLWNPYLWGGMTNAGNPVAQTFYPLTYILCKIFYDPESSTLSYSMLYCQTIIHIYVLAVGFYILLKELKLRKSVCLFIAVLAVFSGCAFRPRAWICLYSGFAYIPLFLAAYIYMVRRLESKGIKHLCIPGAVLGITGLAAVTHGALLNILILIIAYLCYAWSFRADCKKLWTLTWKSFVSGCIGIGVMAVSLLPIAEFLISSYRFTGDSEVIQGLHRMTYDSFAHYTLETTDFQAISGYNGWLAIGMALLLFFIRGLFCGRKRKTPEYWIGVSIAAVSFFYCFGVVINKIVYYIPFLNNIREPYLYSFLFVIGVAVVAAYGLDELLGNMLSAESDEKAKTGGWIVCGLILCVAMVLPMDFTWGNLLVVFGLVFISTVSYKSKKLYCCSLLITALICSHEYYCLIQSTPERTYSREEMIEHIDEINVNAYGLLQGDLPTDADAYRILQWTTQGNAYPANIWSVWGMNETIGYINPIYNKAMNIHLSWNIEKRTMLQNIKYIMCTAKESENYINWLETCGFEQKDTLKDIYPQYEYEEPNDVLVFENRNRQGNAWFVEKAIPYSNDTDITELNDMINSPEFDAARMALLNQDTYEGNIRKSYAQDDTAFVEQREYNANSVKLYVVATDEALIATSEVIVPGWNVYVDGKKADIVEVNTFFRGVIVDRGEHEVVFRYQPLSVGVGAAISLASIILILFGVFRSVIPEKRQ